MDFMARRFLLLLLTVFTLTIQSFAADVQYDLGETRLDLMIKFQKGYSNVNSLRLQDTYVVSFESAEEIDFDTEFWNSPVRRAHITADGDRKKLIFEFTNELIQPEVISQEKSLRVNFKFEKPAQKTETVDREAYGRMIWALIVVLIVILVLYWIIKSVYKKRVYSDIPGTGRLIGKVDIEMRKTLYFYELADYIYILGTTDSSMQLIEKVTDEDQINAIKAGFSRKRDFSNYMNFFRKDTELKDDLEDKKTSIKEKLESIKKR